MTYATDRLFEEVAYVAYHFHWPMDTILDMEHPLRLRFVEEIGSMNVMFVVDGVLVTPALSGSILPGVTRDSVLHLARARGMKVEERPITIDEVLAAIEAGRCSEAFGCGTAAVITAIGSLVRGGNEYALPQAPGPLAEEMFAAITDVQWGRRADTSGWTRIVPRRTS